MPLSTTDSGGGRGVPRLYFRPPSVEARHTRASRPRGRVAFDLLHSATNQLLRNLPTAPLPREDQVSGWLDEWRDYAGDALLTASSDVNNVVRWIQDVNNVVRWIQDADSLGDPSTQRAGKAAAVATALVKQGITIDRAGEMAIASAITTVEQGAGQWRWCGSCITLPNPPRRPPTLEPHRASRCRVSRKRQP